MSVGERIAAQRRRLGRSLTWLANRASISKAHLCDVEKGRKGLGAEKLLAIASALGVTCDSLMASEASGLPATSVSVPPELAALADAERLPFRHVLALLGVWRVLESYGAAKGLPDWRRLYERLRDFLEG